MQQIVDWQKGNATCKSISGLWQRSNIVDENYNIVENYVFI